MNEQAIAAELSAAEVAAQVERERMEAQERQAAAERERQASEFQARLAFERREAQRQQEMRNRLLAADQQRWQSYMQANRPMWQFGRQLFGSMADMMGMPAQLGAMGGGMPMAPPPRAMPMGGGGMPAPIPSAGPSELPLSRGEELASATVGQIDMPRMPMPGEQGGSSIWDLINLATMARGLNPGVSPDV